MQRTMSVGFTCPRCGGHTYGSNGPYRACQGWREVRGRVVSCVFLWLARDDAKYLSTDAKPGVLVPPPDWFA